MPRSPGGLRLHFTRQRCFRQRSKTSLTMIISSTTYSNPQHKIPSPPRRKPVIITRGSTTTRRLVTKTGPLCPSPISGHTDSYRHSLGPTVVTKALYHLLRPLITYPNLLSLLQQITHSRIICSSVSPQGALKPIPSFPTHQARGHIPGEDRQIDFTHMPPTRKIKLMLTLVDTFSG